MKACFAGARFGGRTARSRVFLEGRYQNCLGETLGGLSALRVHLIVADVLCARLVCPCTSAPSPGPPTLGLLRSPSPQGEGELTFLPAPFRSMPRAT